MRILIVTNLYPPRYLGGYELRCAQVARALLARGHQVRVLASTWPVERHSEEVVEGVPVRRALHQYSFPPYRHRRPWRLHRAWEELADRRVLEQELARFRPDVVNFWSLYGLAGILAPLPGTHGIPDVHWIEQAWMLDPGTLHGEGGTRFWTALWDGTWGPGPLRPLLRTAGRLAEGRLRARGFPTRDLRFTPAHVVFVSEFMAAEHRAGGAAFPSTEVIHGGVAVDGFRFLRTAPASGDTLALLYAGQLTRDRGLLTVLEALARLPPEVRRRMRLTVVGDGVPEFEAEARRRTAGLGLGDVVSFAGRVAHDAMPRVYQEHDLLVFPSERKEGLPLTIVEAMLSGCGVVTTGTGGAAEVARLADQPLFPPGDAAALARLLTRLEADREALARSARQGQEVALREFDLRQMVDRFEAALQRVAAGRAA